MFYPFWDLHIWFKSNSSSTRLHSHWITFNVELLVSSHEHLASQTLSSIMPSTISSPLTYCILELLKSTYKPNDYHWCMGCDKLKVLPLQHFKILNKGLTCFQITLTPYHFPGKFPEILSQQNSRQKRLEDSNLGSLL